MASSFGGLSSGLDYHEFEFDSADCTRGYSSQYTIRNWPNFYLGKPLDQVAAVKVLEAEIPFSYYVITAPNNTFLLTEIQNSTIQTSNGVLNKTVTITPGTYTSVTLLAETVLQLNATSATFATAGLNFVYDNSVTTPLVPVSTPSSYNDSTLKFTFKSTFKTQPVGTFSRQFYFIFPANSPLMNIYGFNPSLGLTFASTAPVAGGSSVASCVLQTTQIGRITGPNYVYLNSRTLGSLIKLHLPGSGIINPQESGADGPQIAKIPMNCDFGTVAFWKDPDSEKWFDLGNSTFTGNLDFYLTLGTADYRVPLDLNGLSFSLKLGVLTNKTQHDDYLGGGAQNKRALARTWPTGGSPFSF